eukprot:gene11341-33642_t
MSDGSDPSDCVRLCCSDWSCESFGFFSTWTSADAANMLPQYKGDVGPAGKCVIGKACCVFKDDVDALVSAAATAGTATTGVRAKLPSQDPPFPTSTHVVGTLEKKMYIGINGDEFPITWGADGKHVQGGPTEMNCTYVIERLPLRGVAVPVNGPAASKACPEWRTGIPNLKSSGVLSVDGVLYWAISCFNYGDDEVFNRQRYGK